MVMLLCIDRGQEASVGLSNEITENKRMKTTDKSHKDDG